MRHPIVNFAPDGFSARNTTVQAGNADDSYDDGLVHGHGWAADRAGPTPRRVNHKAERECGYDDGLVHGHGWAVSGG